MLAALGRAHDVEARAYTLHGPVLHALEAAARRGERVVVRLAGQPYEDPNGRLAQENGRLVAELRACGADAGVAEGLHAKTVSIDGTLYLDDRNWAKDDLVICDDDATESASIPMRKSAALEVEATLLKSASLDDDAIVQTESFGRYNAVSGALETLARAGKAPRLMVSARDLRANAKERAALVRLASEGVRVRVCEDSEKLAAVGNRCWIGSANATIAFGKTDSIDWGVCSGDAIIAGAIRARIEARWTSAKDFEIEPASRVPIG